MAQLRSHTEAHETKNKKNESINKLNFINRVPSTE